jgi:hypothetical protein
MGKPFKKGDSRINRNGRPKKGQSLTDILNYKLDETKAGKLRREAVAEKLIDLAEGGDIAQSATLWIAWMEGRRKR